MAEISEYERIRLKNIEENRRMLCQLGLLPEDWKPPVPKLHTPVFVKKPAKPKKAKVENGDQPYLPGRRSLRAAHSNDTDDSDFTDSINGEYSGSESGKEKPKPPKRPNVYGAIEGVQVGDSWETRMECSYAGVHRPTVAGIHPGPEGAYSIALSGGYEDNYDGGESFTYTGAGGRDLKGTKSNPKNLRTGPQVKDQTLEGANGALAASVETRNPVRVIRGYKSNSPYAPEFGYRYDGLYQVESYWTAKGQSGHLVYKFALKRCSDQDPPPWVMDDNNSSTVQEKHHDTSACADEVSNNAKNPFVQLGKKLSVENLHQLGVEGEGSLSSSFVNGKTSSPNTDKGQSNKLTPEKRNSESKAVDIVSVSKSPKKINSKNSPVKTKNSPPINESCKSPVKMIASNQSMDEVSTVHSDVNGSSVSKVKRDLNDSKEKFSVTNDSCDSDSSGKNRDVTENGKLVENVSSDIFEGLSPGFLKSRRRSHDNSYNSSKNKGKKRSPSPDDFAKICDELCNELPKIEKVKRLRFSFEHFTDNDLQYNPTKARRKRASHTPRKSSLITNKEGKNIGNSKQKSDQDLIFSKYVENLLSKFSCPDNDYLGWDDYNDDFKGWTDKDVTEAKKYTSSFSDFIFKCNENSSFSSEESGWAGWEDVSRRSLVLNGFLLEEISRNRSSCDSDRTDGPEEFLGFQQQNEKAVDDVN